MTYDNCKKTYMWRRGKRYKTKDKQIFIEPELNVWQLVQR